jgi:hypothetical protein
MISKLAAGRPPTLRAIPTAAFLFLLLPGAASGGQQGGASASDNGLVLRALAAEVTAAQDTSHPMEFLLRKSTPRLTSTKAIVQTRDGAVARLLSINDAAPSPSDRKKDEARLDALLADPSRQQKRKQGEQNDTGRVLKVLRALPKAFIYQYQGPVTVGAETLQRYTFAPNPKFNPSDLELLVLTAMRGELTVDSARERVVCLEGHLQQDVDIGWGLIGRLNKGGSILIEQADIGQGQWRIVRFQMAMNGRVLFKARSFDTTEEQSHFEPVPLDLTYQQAIQMLRSDHNGSDAIGKLK